MPPPVEPPPAPPAPGWPWVPTVIHEPAPPPPPPTRMREPRPKEPVRTSEAPPPPLPGKIQVALWCREPLAPPPFHPPQPWEEGPPAPPTLICSVLPGRTDTTARTPPPGPPGGQVRGSGAAGGADDLERRRSHPGRHDPLLSGSDVGEGAGRAQSVVRTRAVGGTGLRALRGGGGWGGRGWPTPCGPAGCCRCRAAGRSAGRSAARPVPVPNPVAREPDRRRRSLPSRSAGRRCGGTGRWCCCGSRRRACRRPPRTRPGRR